MRQSEPTPALAPNGLPVLRVEFQCQTQGKPPHSRHHTGATPTNLGDGKQPQTLSESRSLTGGGFFAKLARMGFRHYLPFASFYRGPLLLLKRDPRRAFWARITHVLRHGCTEPTEILMGISLMLTGAALLHTGSEYLSPVWAWAIGYILAGLLMIGAMLTRDMAGRMWSGFICFQLRIWVASAAFLANPPDLQWASALVGSMVGLWLGMRYYCVLLHTPHKCFCGPEKRKARRRMQDYTIDVVGDLCTPQR